MDASGIEDGSSTWEAEWNERGTREEPERNERGTRERIEESVNEQREFELEKGVGNAGRFKQFVIYIHSFSLKLIQTSWDI